MRTSLSQHAGLGRPQHLAVSPARAQFSPHQLRLRPCAVVARRARERACAAAHRRLAPARVDRLQGAPHPGGRRGRGNVRGALLALAIPLSNGLPSVLPPSSVAASSSASSHGDYHVLGLIGSINGFFEFRPATDWAPAATSRTRSRAPNGKEPRPWATTVALESGVGRSALPDGRCGHSRARVLRLAGLALLALIHRHRRPPASSGAFHSRHFWPIVFCRGGAVRPPRFGLALLIAGLALGRARSPSAPGLTSIVLRKLQRLYETPALRQTLAARR